MTGKSKNINPKNTKKKPLLTLKQKRQKKKEKAG
jgi:hypothetical protein